MHEYVTLSSSSYDPAALASKLTEKSGEGWEVVSIVPTGGDVTAFLRRASVASEPETEPGNGVVVPVGADAATDEAAAPDTGDTTGELSVGDAAPLAAVAAADLVEPEPAPSEPAGWAAAPDPTPAATPASDLPVEAAAAVAIAPAADVVEAPVAEPPAADAAPEPTPAPVPAPPAPTPTPSVPAGWYSDPSGRFELRYWDGSQWTEHVARGGAQYTDPPVA